MCSFFFFRTTIHVEVVGLVKKNMSKWWDLLGVGCYDYFWFCLKPCNSAKYMKTNFSRGPLVTFMKSIVTVYNFLLADNFNAPLGFIKSSDLWEYPPEFTRWAPTSYKLELWGPYILGFQPHLRHYKFGEWSELWFREIWVFSDAYRPNMSMTCPNCLAPCTPSGVLGVHFGRKWAVSRLTLVICVFLGGDYTTQLCIKGQ